MLYINELIKSSEEVIIGPVPTNQPEVQQTVSEEFEERAKQMKLKLLKVS